MKIREALLRQRLLPFSRLAKAKQMKQSEKLDLILRGLYQHMNDGLYWPISEVLKPLGIQLNFEELWRLAHRLHDDGYIESPISDGQDVICKITSYGIEYCEESSYTYTGQSIITNAYNITVEDSQNVSVVGTSENVTFSQSSHPSEERFPNVEKIPLRLLLRNLTGPQVWMIISSLVVLIVSTFMLGYSVGQWKLERKQDQLSATIENQKKQIDLLTAQKDSLLRLQKQPANREYK